MGGELEGRNVVLTGAAGGLGTGVLEALLAAGAVCHVPTRKDGELKAAANLHVTPGVDLTSETAVAQYYTSLPALWSSIHLAGGYAGARFTETSLADFRRQLDLNVITAFLCCREAVRKMQSGRGGGRIVNVSSKAALVPAGGSVAYSASKGALTVLTQALAEELKGTGILINAVAPSIIDTAANRSSMPTADFSRWPKAAELANTIMWLASPLNTVSSGAVVPVYGGA